LRLERTGSILGVLIITSLGKVAILRAIGAGFLISQVFFGWTEEHILILVIGEILGSETGFLDPF
jgi:hypothetical protein